MPYAPTVNDNSGQILAQGINQGVQGLAEGIQRSIAERKKKEEERRAKEAVNAAGKGLFGEDFDVKDAKPEQYGTIIGMAQEKANAPMKAAQLAAAQAQQQAAGLQMEIHRRDMEQKQRDDAALQAALAGIDAGGGQGPSVGLTDSQMGMTGARPVQGGVTASDANDVFATAARKGASGAALNQLSAIESHRAAAAENRAQAAQRGMPKPSEQWATSPDGTPYVRTAAGNIQFQPNEPKASKTEADEVIALVNALKQAETAGDKAAAGALADALKKRTTQSSEMAQLVTALTTGGLGLGGKPPAAAPAAAGKPDFSAYEGKRVKGPDGATYFIKNGQPIKQ